MKYSHHIEQTTDRDYAARPSELSPVFKDLVGAVILFAEVIAIMFFILAMGG